MLASELYPFMFTATGMTRVLGLFHRCVMLPRASWRLSSIYQLTSGLSRVMGLGGEHSELMTMLSNHM